MDEQETPVREAGSREVAAVVQPVHPRLRVPSAGLANARGRWEGAEAARSGEVGDGR